jgi:hypothetical protein
VGLALLVTVFGTASRSAAKEPLADASPVLRAHDIMTRAMATTFTVAAIGIAAAVLLALFAIKITPKER